MSVDTTPERGSIAGFNMVKRHAGRKTMDTEHWCAQGITGMIKPNPRGPCKDVDILSFPSYKWGHETHPKSHWVWRPCFTCSHHCCLLQTVHVRHLFLTWEQTLAICLNSLLSLMRKIVPKNCYALGFESESTALPSHYIFYDPNVRTSRFWDMLCKGLFSTTLRNAVILISDGSRMTIQLNRPGLEHKC